MGTVGAKTSSRTHHHHHHHQQPSMAHNDPYAGIEFDDITESTGLAADEIKCLKTCFDLFDTKKVDFLSADDLGEIMRAMGFRPTEEELKDLLAEIDEDGSGEIEFAEFCQLCATFLVEDPDMETMKRELDEDGSGSMDFDEFCEMMMTKPE